MIIIQLKGGLGNQMFQYALYKELKHRGKEVKIDDVNGFIGDELRVPVLQRFGVEYDRATKEEIVKLTDSKMDIFSRIRRKLTGRKTFRIDEMEGLFDPHKSCVIYDQNTISHLLFLLINKMNIPTGTKRSVITASIIVKLSVI